MKFVHGCVGVSVLAVAFCLCLAILDGRALIKAQNGVAQREGAKTRDLADRHARQIEQDLRLREDAALDEVKALHASADKQLTAMQNMLDRRSGDALAQVSALNGTVATFGTSVSATLAGEREDLKPTLQNAQNITGQFNRALPQFLNCDHNPDCVFGRYVDTSKGIERAAINFGSASANITIMTSDMRKALPQMLQTVQDAGTDFRGIAANVKKLTTPKWYDRVIGYGLSAGAAYRDLNPGYNAASAIRGLFTKHKEQ